MSEMKHTEGPWVQFVLDGECRAIMPAGRDGDICGFDLAPSEANAALMTAAPEIIEALRAMTQRYVDLVNSGDAGFWDPEEDAEVIAARAAIAKAQGRQP